MVRYALASCRARSPSLRQELLAFLSEVVSRNLWFQVLRIPTALNVVADALSREEPQYGVDPPSSGFRRRSALGWSSGGGPNGFSCQPPPAPLGVSLSSPGRSGGGLSKYRLEPLWVLLSVSSSGHASATPTPYPLVQVAVGDMGRRDSVAPTRPVVSSVVTEGGRPPPPAGDSLSADGRGDRVALIRSLRMLDRTAFWRQVLGARGPARAVSTLLAAFRPSSQRQHDLAWRTFQAWLPVNRLNTCDV